MKSYTPLERCIEYFKPIESILTLLAKGTKLSGTLSIQLEQLLLHRHII